MIRTMIGAVLVFFLQPAQAALILDYPKTMPEVTPMLPVSAFHDWAQANEAADLIVAAWKTEPASLGLTRLQLSRHIKHKTMPTRGARGLALTHVAMHDAYELAIQKKEEPRFAMLMASAVVLSYLYVTEEREFERIAFAVAAKITKSEPSTLSVFALRSLGLGKAVGERVIDRALHDGAQRGWNGARLQWYGQGRYFGPGSWEPTPPYFYYPPDEPFTPTWQTWILRDGSQFRPEPPPFGSTQYRKDLGEVIQVNKELTESQLKIAKFWVDGHGSITPPGRWNQIAIDEVLRSKLDERGTLALFAKLNIALADTFVAVWDAKYFYWTARPITVAEKMFGVSLQPPILTPPFPSFPSGHAAFSGAAATILTDYFPARKTQLDAMADEASMSRLLGGIHFRHDNEAGLALGRRIATFILSCANGKPALTRTAECVTEDL